MKLQCLFSSVMIALVPFICQAADLAVTEGLGFQVSFFDLNFKLYGIIATPLMGGLRMVNGDIRLPIDGKTRLTYSSAGVEGGRLLFTGGIQLATVNKRITLTDFFLGAKGGTVAVMMDGKGASFAIVDSDRKKVQPIPGTKKIQFTYSIISIDPSILTYINTQLGATLPVKDPKLLGGASISYILDVSLINTLNADLVQSLSIPKDLQTALGINVM